MTNAVYLDHNATAPMRPEVAEAMAAAFGLVGNPSSVHRFGRRARQAVEEARGALAALVGATPEQVVFTSGGTEANALALSGSGCRCRLVSAVEHESVLKAAPAECIPVDRNGVVVLERLEAMLQERALPTLVSVMLANNETGVIQPVGEVAARARSRGAVVHCDAVQALGRIGVGFETLGVDMLTLSAHKIGGPQGVGALVVGKRVAVEPLLKGGGQERFRRAGTENVAGIVGFGTAAALAGTDLASAPEVAARRDAMEARLKALAPGLRIWGAGTERLPNTSCVEMPRVAGETQVMALDLAGVAVSAGAACSSGRVRASHVLAAMGATPEEAGSAIRVSLDARTTEDEIERFIEAWGVLYARSKTNVAAAQPAA